MDNNKTEHQADNDYSIENLNRRKFFRMSAVTAGVVAAGSAAGWINHRVQGVPYDSFPVEIKDDELKPMDQRNLIFSYALSPKEQRKYPEREKAFGDAIGDPDFKFRKVIKSLMKHSEVTPEAWDNSKLGYRQIDWALALASKSSLDRSLAPFSKFGVPNTGEHTWEQLHLAPVKWQFESPAEASQHIKRASHLFGAVRVGITPNDPRWNYSPLYDAINEKTYSWEDDFPFKPKSVIVLAFEQDYEAIRAAPAPLAIGSVNNEYTNMSLVAGQLADFIRRLGYKAVASGNDLGNNVAYGIASGIGEGARNGTLIVPKLGNRVRLAKVYTDLDLVEYDMPRNFGIMEFCENCKRCAEQCPSNAISMDDKPDFYPTYEDGDNPDYAWHGQIAVKKFYNDAKKCFKYWGDNGIGCAICIKACPWNKPDFWHHRLIDASNTFTSGFVHRLMKDADILFGYGNMDVDNAVQAFWHSDKES
ncbi:reductive dehalogenase [Photobacterium sagamiensis]|uniref:reductive dehalogenase n=1 Tax=Photobacterium sagamiensis TaxID=2910241 RepID=UPI003D130A71